VDERDARAEVANRARELAARYGLGKEYRLVQETHGRHFGISRERVDERHGDPPG
jgi:hypothetical protein